LILQPTRTDRTSDITFAQPDQQPTGNVPTICHPCQFDIIKDPPKEKTQHPKLFWLPVEIAMFTLLAFLAIAPVAGV
jgi:hypothetical protein